MDGANPSEACGERLPLAQADAHLSAAWRANRPDGQGITPTADGIWQSLRHSALRISPKPAGPVVLPGQPDAAIDYDIHVQVAVDII